MKEIDMKVLEQHYTMIYYGYNKQKLYEKNCVFEIKQESF